MSQAATPSAHEHPPFLAHHFDTPAQQFESGKLGLWLFLTTEILLFSGLFCWYAVYRHNHPEIFAFGHLWLNKWLGAANTVILLFSSFTMAWGVRAAQLGQRRLLIRLLTITLLCGVAFLVIKGFEYSAKVEHGTLWGDKYTPHAPPEGADIPGATPHIKTDVPNVAHAPIVEPKAGAPLTSNEPATTPAPPTLTEAPHPAPAAPTTGRTPEGYLVQRSTIPPAAVGPPGVNPHWRQQIPEAHEWHGPEPANVNVFFGIYFVMTGLHGLHVIAGMVCIGWILRRSIRGDFGPEYFFPVDFTGLYWHLVDLVWIFLFPLLYLIK